MQLAELDRGRSLTTALALGAVALIASVSIAAGPAATGSIPRFRHVVLIVFENKDYGQVIGQSSAPVFNRLARRYALLTRYEAVARPSLPNYLALVSGSTQGVTENCDDCSFSAKTLADTIAASRRTWKTYAEDLPEPGFTGATSGNYAKRHNPLLYFRNVLSSSARLSRIVPLRELQADLEAGRLPHFSLVIPNLCSDMHDCTVSHGDAWLGAFLEPLLASSQLAESAVFVTFDEGAKVEGAKAGGHVATIVLGPLVRRGARSAVKLDHYSLLRTIEDSWGLPRLGRSSTARPILGIWR